MGMKFLLKKNKYAKNYMLLESFMSYFYKQYVIHTKHHDMLPKCHEIFNESQNEKLP